VRKYDWYLANDTILYTRSKILGTKVVRTLQSESLIATTSAGLIILHNVVVRIDASLHFAAERRYASCNYKDYAESELPEAAQLPHSWWVDAAAAAKGLFDCIERAVVALISFYSYGGVEIPAIVVLYVFYLVLNRPINNFE